MIGWMHPVLAEIAMATSSNSVVGNANRLKRVDIRARHTANEARCPERERRANTRSGISSRSE